MSRKQFVVRVYDSSVTVPFKVTNSKEFDEHVFETRTDALYFHEYCRGRNLKSEIYQLEVNT